MASSGIVGENLRVSYGRHRVLDELSLRIEPGVGTALVGRNGAGKSTLLRALVNGFGVRVEGSVTIDGIAVERWRMDRIVRDLKVGFVPDDRRIFPLSTAENLRAAGRGARDWKQYADRALSFFPFLESRMDQLATTLSGGEQQALAIARATMQSPRTLILDEPGEGLSPIAIQGLISGLIELRAELNCTLILVERNMDMVRSLCRDAYGMTSGRLSWSGSVSELDADPTILTRLLLPHQNAFEEHGVGPS